MTITPANGSRWPRLEILETTVTAFDREALLEFIGARVASGEGAVLGVYNLHALYVLRRTPQMHAFYSQTTHNVIDGMSLVALGRLAGAPVRRAHRVPYPDVFPELMNQARANGWKIYHVGGKPGVVERAIEQLLGSATAIDVRSHHGDFDINTESAGTKRVLDDISAFQPDLLFVGLGMPRQELWVLSHLNQLNGMVVLPCGATVEYFGGDQPLPPRWLGRVGLEWVYRLLSNPRRLWHRYLIEPLVLAPSLVAQVANQRWYRLFGSSNHTPTSNRS